MGPPWWSWRRCAGCRSWGNCDALGSSTRGLGQTIAAALEAGATSLVIALGGSASTDGGAGALAALGLHLADAQGHSVNVGGAALADLHAVDRSRLLSPPPGGVTALTDVTAPLLGPAGAAAVFGPQKGASAADVRLLDSALAHFVSLMGGSPDAPGAGAAGGTAYGFSTAWGARIVPGADYVQRLTGLWDALADVDLVITGEGQYDAQSGDGKVVGQVLRRAASVDTPAAVIAGRVVDPPPVWSVSLADLAGGVEGALAEPTQWLRAAGGVTAAQFSLRQYPSRP